MVKFIVTLLVTFAIASALAYPTEDGKKDLETGSSIGLGYGLYGGGLGLGLGGLGLGGFGGLGHGGFGLGGLGYGGYGLYGR